MEFHLSHLGRKVANEDKFYLTVCSWATERVDLGNMTAMIFKFDEPCGRAIINNELMHSMVKAFTQDENMILKIQCR
jgi:hypothetical protein